MTFQVVHQQHPKPAQSPYRIVQREAGCEAAWVNRFLSTGKCIRCLAETTLRSYAHDHAALPLPAGAVHGVVHSNRYGVTEKKHLQNRRCLEYVRFQSRPSPRPRRHHQTAALVVADRALKSEFPNALASCSRLHRLYWKDLL